MALPTENDLKFEIFVLEKIKAGATINSIAKLFEGEEFEKLKGEYPELEEIFFEFINKYKGLDSKDTYKKRVKKIDNINSKFKKLNSSAKSSVEYYTEPVNRDENLIPESDFTNKPKRNREYLDNIDYNKIKPKNRDYLNGLDYDNIKFNTKFGRMTMEELAQNVEIKADMRDVFYGLFGEMKERVVKTAKDFQTRIESMLAAKSDPKDLMLLTQAQHIYIKTHKNFVPIPNLENDASGAKELIIMEVGGTEKGMIKKSVGGFTKDDLNSEELEMLELGNSPSL